MPGSYGGGGCFAGLQSQLDEISKRPWRALLVLTGGADKRSTEVQKPGRRQEEATGCGGLEGRVGQGGSQSVATRSLMRNPGQARWEQI